MGQLESKLSLSYSIKEKISENTFLALYKASRKTSGSSVSVFTQKTNADIDPEIYDLIQHAMKKLRTIRHPGIIKFIEGQVDANNIFIVTEPVIPLGAVIKSMQADDICVGLYSLLKTVDFLHSHKLCHNALQLDSIYISENDGRWVLGGMEFLKSFDEINEEFLHQLEKYLSDNVRPPEDIDVDLIPEQMESRDFYALGHLISDMVAPFLTPAYIQANSNSMNWKEMQASLDQTCSRNPNKRFSPKGLLETSFFKNNVLIDVVENFKELRGLPVELKHRFFTQLPVKIKCLPQSTVDKIILPLLLNQELFSESGSESVFMSLFSVKYQDEKTLKKKRSLNSLNEPASKFIISKIAYEQRVLPFIIQSITNREYESRIMCLRLINLYIEQLSIVKPEFLTLFIDEILLGLDEIDVDIYLYSVYGLASLVPYWIYSQISPAAERNSLEYSGSTEDLKNLSNSVANQKILSHSKSNLDKIVNSSAESGNTPAPRTLTLETNMQGAKKINLAPKSKTKNNDSETQALVIHIVESIIVPHCLKTCVSNEFTIEQKWIVLDALILLWKKLCLVSIKTSLIDIPRLIRSIFKCFHVLMRVLEPSEKIEFFCQRLIGKSDILSDPNSMQWISRIMELGIHFLKDDNKKVRQEIGQTMITIISVLSAALDNAPSISRKREHESLKGKLQSAYKSLARNNNNFHRAGPRIVFGSPNSDIMKTPILSNISLDGKVDEKTWGENWDEEFQDSDHDAVPELDIDAQLITKAKDEAKSELYKLKKYDYTKKEANKQASTSDIADIGLGALDDVSI